MKINIFQKAYDLGFTAGKMAGYAKALEDMRNLREQRESEVEI